MLRTSPFVYDHAIVIGDMHVKKDDVAEATRFVRWIAQLHAQVKAKIGVDPLIVFMGDQYNDFSVVRVEAEVFWDWAFDFLVKETGTMPLALVGNHDMNQEETASSMQVHARYAVLAERKPVFINQATAAIGFMRKEELFHQTVMEAYQKGARIVLCHAEFDGAQYENGFYSPHGFKLDRYPQDLQFISGHIHLKQQFGKVLYVGTPRHLTRSDLGTVKGVHVVKFSAGSCEFVATPPDTFTPFQSVVIDESVHDPKSLPEIANSPRSYVEIRGSKEFAKKVEKALPELCKFRSVYTDQVRDFKVKESSGIPASFMAFADDFAISTGMSAQKKADVLKLIYDTCPSLKNGVTK